MKLLSILSRFVQVEAAHIVSRDVNVMKFVAKLLCFVKVTLIHFPKLISVSLLYLFVKEYSSCTDEHNVYLLSMLVGYSLQSPSESFVWFT